MKRNDLDINTTQTGTWTVRMLDGLRKIELKSFASANDAEIFRAMKQRAFPSGRFDVQFIPRLSIFTI